MVKLVDVHVGKRIRQRRWQIEMTQKDLAEQVGVKFQQMQKYETGSNRVSASRLWEISRVLDVSVAYFFEGLKKGDSELESLASDYKATLLLSHYYKIPLAKRRAVLNFAMALAAIQLEG